MNSKTNRIPFVLLLTLFILVFYFPSSAQEEAKTPPLSDEQKILNAMHTISSETLFNYVKELCSDKFEGRLTGTPSYNASGQWVASLLTKWGVKPAGDNGTYFQEFPNPYSLIQDEGNLTLHIPFGKNNWFQKPYRYELDYFPGATSDTGEIKAEVIYVGYGITAPELNYDDYKGIDVKGKIVVFEREVPVSPTKNPDEFKKWRPYSFHTYKVQNAKDHGAAAAVFNYQIINPNCIFIKDFIIANIGDTVINDLFMGTGKIHAKLVELIDKTLKPGSFNTGKILSIKVSTKHFPDGIGNNVIGIIEGSDPVLKNEAIMLGGHLDHLGMAPRMMPGANDNASAVAVMLGVAEAIYKSGIKPKRSIIFNFFGSEEQGVKGSEYYLAHPLIPNNKIFALLNMDGVGRGTKIDALAGKNFPQLWKFIDDANKKYIHREVISHDFPNLARPRLDAAQFMWAGVPTISFSTSGGEEPPYPYYHTTNDNPIIITPEIMEDLSQLIFIATMELTQY